jgi:hypothetical protein
MSKTIDFSKHQRKKGEIISKPTAKPASKPTSEPKPRPEKEPEVPEIVVGNKKFRYNSDLMRSIYFLIFGISTRAKIKDLAKLFIVVFNKIIKEETNK